MPDSSKSDYCDETNHSQYNTISHRETKEQANIVAPVLIAPRINQGDIIALLSESRTDRVISELGILHAVAISGPLSILQLHNSGQSLYNQHC